MLEQAAIFFCPWFVTGAHNSSFNNFLWGGDNLLQEHDANGATQAHYTDHPGSWGGLSSMRRDNASHFYGFDTIANTRFLTDSNGSLTDRYHYKGFGETLPGSGTTANPHRYSGQTHCNLTIAAPPWLQTTHPASEFM